MTNGTDIVRATALLSRAAGRLNMQIAKGTMKRASLQECVGDAREAVNLIERVCATTEKTYAAVSSEVDGKASTGNARVSEPLRHRGDEGPVHRVRPRRARA